VFALVAAPGWSAAQLAPDIDRRAPDHAPLAPLATGFALALPSAPAGALPAPPAEHPADSPGAVRVPAPIAAPPPPEQAGRRVPDARNGEPESLALPPRSDAGRAP
jgi:hypothetical protein